MLNPFELRRYGLRAADGYEMRRSGMADDEIEDAVKAWYELGQPETAWEREREAAMRPGCRWHDAGVGPGYRRVLPRDSPPAR